MTVDRAALIAWVEATCRAQGVPVKVSDGRAVRSMAVLLGADVTARASPEGYPAP